MTFSYDEFDLSDIKTYPLKSRASKVRVEDFARPVAPSASLADFCMIRFHVITSPPEWSSTHSASRPSLPARPVSC